MKQIFVRQAVPNDAPIYQEWAPTTKDALLDPGVLTYPSTRVLVAHHGDPVLMMPVQTAFVLESLAVKPGLSPLEEAEALKQLTKTVAYAAGSQGVREIYFLCKDERVVEFAKRHGYEEIPWKCLRLKLDDVEKCSTPKS